MGETGNTALSFMIHEVILVYFQELLTSFDDMNDCLLFPKDTCLTSASSHPVVVVSWSLGLNLLKQEDKEGMELEEEEEERLELQVMSQQVTQGQSQMCFPGTAELQWQ